MMGEAGLWIPESGSPQDLPLHFQPFSSSCYSMILTSFFATADTISLPGTMASGECEFIALLPVNPLLPPI